MEQHNVLTPSGTRLHVVDGGNPQGRPILFVHGWSQSHLCWSKQFDSPLASRFRLVAMDLRGHGDSDKPENGYGDGAMWASDVRAVIQGLSLNRPLLVAWSYGGLVVNDYLRHEGQEAVAGVCYVGAATDLGIETSYPFLGATWNGLLPSRPDDTSGTVFSDDAEEVSTAMRRFIDGCFSKPLSADEAAMILGFNMKCPSRVRAALFDRTIANDDLLPQIRVPARVIHGVEDEVIRIETGRHIAALLTGGATSEYDDAGHAPFWEDARSFNDELGVFASALS